MNKKEKILDSTLKKLALLLCLIFTASSFQHSFASEIPQEQKIILKTSLNEMAQGELFDDLDTWSMSPSQIQMGYEDAVRRNNVNNLLCNGVEDPKCNDVLRLLVRAYLPTCTDASTQYCVEDFSAYKDGVRTQGRFISAYPSEPLKGQFDANPRYGLPAGKAGGLWQLPGLKHEGGADTYWVNAQLFGDLGRKSAQDKFPQFTPYNLWSSISAVSEVDVPGSKPVAASDLGGGDGLQRRDVGDGRQCLISGSNKCLIAWSLDKSIAYSMTVRMAVPLSSWMHGRLSSPEVNAYKGSDGFFRLVLKGNPVTVPTLFAEVAWKNATPEMKARFGQKPSGCCGWTAGGWYDSAGRNQSSEQMVSDLKLWLPLVNDKASASPTYWIVRSAVWGENVDMRCLDSNSVNGIVTTNATAYTSGAPVFNSQTQSLDYKVSSPHLDQDGKVNVGTYNLQINSKLARCIYGFTNAPVSASISVVGEGGENRIAVTSVQEKNGWIYLSASGFTYSAPTLRVRLTQQAAAPSKKKEISIVCKKGSKTVKVTAVIPKCPSGYIKR